MISLIIGTIIAAILIIFGFWRIEQKRSSVLFFVSGTAFLIAGTFLYPYSNVWQKSLSGKAALQEAEYSRQIKVREAQATLDSAKMLADAEIARAKGIAEANRIVADGLGGPEGYLRYLYIDGLKDTGAQVIYIPTEAGLPILEAGRANK